MTHAAVPDRLFHYTCDHRRAGIITVGRVLPLAAMIPGTEDMPFSRFAWFTDLAYPMRDALGLTSELLSCDRTQHRFRATDTTELRPWIEARHQVEPRWMTALESAPGARPRHWYVATVPVPVTPDPYLEDA